MIFYTCLVCECDSRQQPYDITYKNCDKDFVLFAFTLIMYSNLSHTQPSDSDPNNETSNDVSSSFFSLNYIV